MEEHEQVLVDMVKLAQKEGLQGGNGSWKQFLNVYDRKFGSSLSDPARRPREALVSFLQTFTEKAHVKFFAHILRKHTIWEAMEKVGKESPDKESPEQRLVRLTVEDPYYMLKYSFPSYDKEWLVTKVRKKIKLTCSNSMLAIDCEMVLCEDGTDALVRVCIVDQDLQVKLDELVNPCKPIADYRTEITGVTADDFNKACCSLADIQKNVKKLLSKTTILVGHSLYNDLRALRLDHARVIDTSFVFRTPDGLSPSLNYLCKSLLGYELRKEATAHSCYDDAVAAMKLVLAKMEQGVGNNMPLIQENTKNVPESEMAKLLVHRIPISVPTEELYGILPGNFIFEQKPPKKGQSIQHSAHAIFNSPQEAHQAFENVQGHLEKDKSGLPQKLIRFKLSSGEIVGLYVRKMAEDYSLHQVSPKRKDIQDENSGHSKKQKMDPCDDHLQEIETLKQELGEKDNQCDDCLKEIESLKKELTAKDFQVSTQDKIIAELKKKLTEQKRSKKQGW
uniref:Exonuclease n=1 Tax=Rhizophora mucronata TaxID=61149 RepID=A0A2P2KGS1_RHIMU